MSSGYARSSIAAASSELGAHHDSSVSSTSHIMKRPKHLLVRDDHGKQVVILEIELDTSSGQPKVRYELANRSEVTRISDTEFVVVQTGAVLNMTPSRVSPR